MPCEMCGEDRPIQAMIEVEGARMQVCALCVRFGRVVETPGAPKAVAAREGAARGLQTREKRMTEKPVPLEGADDLVADFGERVRVGRERKRLSLDDLARAVNEKKSLLAKVEAGSFFPDPHVTRKIEAALGIKLREKVEEVHTEKVRPRGGMTIGDLIKMQKE